MKSKILRTFLLLTIMTLTGVACTLRDGVITGGYMHYDRDFYYRNPWYDYDRVRRPIIITPPPVIEPPVDNIDPDFGVDPEPMLMN